jgi:hypothetical protein
MAKEGKGLVILEDVTTAPPAVQGALLGFVQFGKVGDICLPREVVRVMTANPSHQVSGWDFIGPLANRMGHLEAGVLSPTEWYTGMLTGDWEEPVLRVGAGEGRVAALGVIHGFLTRRQELFLKLPSEKDKEVRSFPTPRSWSMAADVLGAALVDGAWECNELTSAILDACVGHGAAHECFAWAQALDLPDPAEVLRAPTKWQVPKREDQRFAALGSVVGHAIYLMMNQERQTEQEKIWRAVWKAVGVMCAANSKDVAAVSARVLMNVKLPGPRLPVCEEVALVLPVLRYEADKKA